MGILSFRNTLRSSHRLGQILSVLVRHGFGHLVVSLRLERLVPFRKKLAHPAGANPREDLTVIAKRAADALEDLGPTYVKLGQAMASRPDLLPQEFLDAFRRLQDKCRPFEFAEVRRTIEHSLGAALEETFPQFETTPFASGSIAQAHYATTADGTEVVVKVRRPGIERTVANDVALLRTLADLLERHAPEYRMYRPRMLVDEFEHTLGQELDFVNEAAITSRFHETFAEDPTIRTPKVFWDQSAADVLTLQRLKGAAIGPGTDYEALGVNRQAAARHLLDAFFRQFFEIGLFHADPHPGNLMIRPPSSWSLVDFGQVGRMDEEMRSRLAMLLTAATNRDLDLVVDILDDLETLPEEIDRSHLKGNLAALLDKYYGLPIKRMRIGTVFEEVVSLARQHRVVLPRSFVLLGKSLATVGGTAMGLDPECAPIEIIEPKLRELLRRTISPGRMARSLGTNAYHLGNMLYHGPQMVRRVMRNLMRGKTRIIFHHDGLSHFIQELDRSSNRIAFSVVTAAIILGSSIIIRADVGPKWGDVSWLGLGGFVIAAMSGLWLIISIFRSGQL